jgi:hypothetical protein
MSAIKNISIDELFAASYLLWTNRLIADQIALEAIMLINKAHSRKFSFLSGKTSRWIVGGLFYLLSYRHDTVKKQNEIAAILGTSEVTIRDSYRQWIETFPDLFGDIIEKFLADDKLRYYILTNLNKKGYVEIKI